VVASSIEVRPSAAARAMVVVDIKELDFLALTGVDDDLLYCPGVADDLTDIRGRGGVRSGGWGCLPNRDRKEEDGRSGLWVKLYRLRADYEGLLKGASVG